MIKPWLNQVCPDMHRKKLKELQTNNFFFYLSKPWSTDDYKKSIQ